MPNFQAFIAIVTTLLFFTGVALKYDTIYLQWKCPEQID
jgi:hypothetical protein